MRHNVRMATAGSDDAALDEVAFGLYALTPDEFTAARNAAAKATDDKVLGRRIMDLRKPTAAAYAVDLLARDAGDQLAEAIELSAALREAQDDLDGAELARLGRQRRALVAALAGQASALAKDRGVTVSSAALADVEQTLNAAVTDAAAAAAVLTARLARPLAASGLEPVDLEGAVGGSVPGVADAPPPQPRDDLAERRARRAAQTAAREAAKAASEADRALAKSDARLTKAREKADRLSERIADLRAQLAQYEADAEAAAAELDAAEAEQTDAASVARSARKTAESARIAAEELT